ncbi:MAG TPA: helix-turn-helix domain-containing protein [Parafilimonas sp.]|nr:helix-turn-helix domain-containing protein [Parafilimonas sp.]
MQIQFCHIEPHFQLKNYIEKMWLFKSSGKMPVDDMKLVVPNGNLKLTVSYQNGIVAALNGKTFASKEHDITLTGFIDVPVILDVEEDVATETIGIEFTPHGAYRFFHFNLNHIQNQIYSLTDVLGNTGKQLIEKMNNMISTQQKIIALQQFLLKQLSLQQQDLIFDYCIEKITASKGKITIKELEKKTGYSSRWLNIKFIEKIGVSPKNLASIIRFKQYYEAFVNNTDSAFFRKDFYELYYDQSHFIKDFKRFTGLPPTRFEKQLNDFGKSYYSR